METTNTGAVADDVLRATGLLTLGDNPPAEAVESALRRLAMAMEDAGELRRAILREGAIQALKDTGIGAPARVVDAALADRQPGDTPDLDGRGDREDDARLGEDAEDEARDLLTASDLLDRALSVMQKRGLVDEETNAKLVLLSGVGGLVERPIHLVIHGDSSAGKNNLVRRALELLPPKKVLAVSGLSEHALEYRGGRIEGALVVDEAEGQGRAEYGLRVAMSEGRITRLTVNKGDDGQNEAQELEVEVAASVITTTTSPALHAENQTRVFDLFADEGKELTEKVLRRRAREADGTAVAVEDDDLETWRAALRLLEPAPVVIPWATTLADDFPTGQIRARRDFPRVLALVEACALLHQEQRPRDDDGKVIAASDDWRIIRPLVQAVLGPSMTGINETAVALCKLHDELVEGAPGEWVRRPDLESEAAARDIASRNTVHRWAKRLAELGVWKGRREKGGAWEHRRLRDVVKEPIPLPTADELPEGPSLPTPPNRGGGRRSSHNNADDRPPPNENPEYIEEGFAGEDENDWEGSENPCDTRGNPSHQGGMSGLGGWKGAPDEAPPPEWWKRRPGETEAEHERRVERAAIQTEHILDDDGVEDLFDGGEDA